MRLRSSKAGHQDQGTTTAVTDPELQVLESRASAREQAELPDVTFDLIDRLTRQTAQADRATTITTGTLRSLARALGMSPFETRAKTDTPSL